MLLFLLRALTLALVWFVIVNGAATLAVIGLTPRLLRQQRVRSAAFWLSLRLFPSAASIVLVTAVFVPAYWLHEPRGYDEGFQAVLVVLAVLAAAVIATAVSRGVAASRRAARRAAGWARMAEPIFPAGATMPAFRIDVDAPVMALVGVFTPTLFVSRRVMTMLSEEELAASVGHEVGHRRALDNLKRLVLCATPDLLARTSTARELEQRWAAAAEHDADRRACENADDDARAGTRCALASAIVKVARLMPPTARITEPISTLVDNGDIESRVHRLLEDAAPERSRTLPWSLAAAAAAAIAIAAIGSDSYAPVLRAVHEATEVLVRTLP